MKIRPGEIVALAGKIYGRCPQCDEIIRVDKPLLGSLHFCVTEEEEESAAQNDGET